MASSQFDSFGFNPDLYLNPNETDLLIAALDSNKPTQSPSNLPSDDSASFAQQPSTNGGTRAGGNTSRKATNTSTTSAELENHPYLDFDTSEGVWDWNLGGLPENFSAEPGMTAADRRDSADSEDDDDSDKQMSPEAGDEGEPGDKRKSINDPATDDGGGKRQETESKSGKKQSQRPGRKPLTSEPTTKRKAQNRAAQRAFRERKEKHLKDLETTVDELKKESEEANHENVLLRAQVERLETEVKEYRKQLSHNPSVNAGSPTFGNVGTPFSSRNNFDIYSNFNNNFNFEFPKFGAVNDGKIRPAPTNTGLGKTNNPKVTSPGSVSSNRSNSHPVPPASVNSDLSTLFTPDILTSANNRSNSVEYRKKSDGKEDGRSNAAIIPRTSTDSNTASPASSGSNIGFTSSCATTPEATCETPDQRKDTGVSLNGVGNGGKFGTQEAFCKDFQKACGNKENPVPPMMSNSSNDIPAATPALTTQSQDSSLDFNGFDWMANQNGGSFDPILFGDYREPQESIMSSEFNFFNDAFPALPDFASPQSQASQTQPLETNLPKKKDLMQQIEDQQAGKELEVVPGEERQQFLTCNLLWDRVQRSQKVQSGEADMDDLCTQLKSKAKCSGSGAVISQSDVDAILGPPAGKDNGEPDFLKMFK